MPFGPGFGAGFGSGFARSGEGPTDLTPDPFTFADQFAAEPSTQYTSAPITVSGIDGSVTISVTGGEYSVNGGSFTSSNGSVSNGDEVRARGTSSDEYSTSVSVTVTIGGVSDTYSIMTYADPEAVTGAHSHAVSPGGMGRMMGRA